MATVDWTRERLAPIIAVIITLVWAGSFLFDMFTEYEQNPAITPIMLTVAGWLFGSDLLNRRREGKEVLDSDHPS